MLQYLCELISSLIRLFQCPFYDIVWIQKSILLTNFKGLECVYDWFSRRLIFDLDDAVYHGSIVEFSWPPLRFLQDREQLGKLSRRCRAVVAGNAYLAKMALAYNPTVYTLPTPVDVSRITMKTMSEKAKDEKIVIGWLGTATGLEYFSLIEEALRIICKRYPVIVRIVTRLKARHFSIEGVTLEFKDWALEDENSDFHSFDIAISPLKDDEWTRGKCSLKLLQYMAAGLPAVSSKNGMNLEVVDDGTDGFLADGTVEWVEKLTHLIEDAGLRQSMGQAARKKIEEKYDLAGRSEELITILKETGSV
ncbi:MAG: glycosyltransferase family 4 protein [Candidatus Omnitrophica bacterium]|nr:glycosyltransferase family 4 protein [Candidatus Omnitrophota bacterium]